MTRYGRIGAVGLMAAIGLLAGMSLVSAGAAAMVASVDEAAIRDRVKAYETEFNAGDVSAVIAEYDPSMSGIEAAAFLDYDGYMAAVRKLLVAPDRGRMRLELHSINRLGKSHMLANGQVIMISKDGAEQRGPFTLIYLKSAGRWKLVYVHA